MTTAGPLIPQDASPFHAGEQTMQSRAGVREQTEQWGRQIVRSHLPEQHRDFYSQLPFVVVAARDDAERVWASILSGAPGFITSPDPSSLAMATRPLPGDALEQSLGAGADLGMLGIELHSRRRNRVNGTLTQVGRRGMTLEVGQTFGNCPQYITERQWQAVAVDSAKTLASRSRSLDASAQAWIASADTLFIASGFAQRRHAGDALGMDASHRGGVPGFVTVQSDRRLVIPDYAGNNHFNTVGNLLLDPRVGLLFVDFKRGSLLQLTGRATIEENPDAVSTYAGAKRLIVVDVEAVNRLDDVLPLRWADPSTSVRELRVIAKEAQSADVTSFKLAPPEGDTQALAAYQPGQHLPIEVEIDGQWESRTYTLSQAPGHDHYRISVKREAHGRVSRFLHDALAVGDVLRARAPAGDFVLRESERPIVLASAGVGVTPMLSMLETLAAARDPRPLTFLHGARDGDHYPFADAIEGWVREHGNASAITRFSRSVPSQLRGAGVVERGRLDVALLAQVNPALDADFYLCGPQAFLSAMTAGLRALGVAEDRILLETF
ncbi:MAG: pyridoxamine 5'-phosphate oxidase family protein [Pseudomonadota bacterium]